MSREICKSRGHWVEEKEEETFTDPPRKLSQVPPPIRSSTLDHSGLVDCGTAKRNEKKTLLVKIPKETKEKTSRSSGRKERT